MKIDRKKITGFAHGYRVDDGAKFRLKDFHTDDKDGIESHDEANELLAESVKLMSDMQEKLYAQEKWSLLLIFQAMDAAGKDGTIKHVMSGVNPQGCQVTSFKSPSATELSHDFLWRCNAALPERGRIGIFNRSYYEEVLVVRVHKEMLRAQRIPPALVTKHIWKERLQDIAAHEAYLHRNGVVVRKFFLNVSKKEQRKRFLARVEEPAKNWKISGADLNERAYWHEYMDAYEDAIRRTATPGAPWYIVPADHKWYAHLVVAGALIETLDSLGLTFPTLVAAQKKTLAQARKLLRG